MDRDKWNPKMQKEREAAYTNAADKEAKYTAAVRLNNLNKRREMYQAKTTTSLPYDAALSAEVAQLVAKTTAPRQKNEKIPTIYANRRKYPPVYFLPFGRVAYDKNLKMRLIAQTGMQPFNRNYARVAPISPEEVDSYGWYGLQATAQVPSSKRYFRQPPKVPVVQGNVTIPDTAWVWTDGPDGCSTCQPVWSPPTTTDMLNVDYSWQYVQDQRYNCKTCQVTKPCALDEAIPNEPEMTVAIGPIWRP